MLNSKLLKNSREAKYVMPNPENVILNLALKQVQGLRFQNPILNFDIWISTHFALCFKKVEVPVARMVPSSFAT